MCKWWILQSIYVLQHCIQPCSTFFVLFLDDVMLQLSKFDDNNFNQAIWYIYFYVHLCFIYSSHWCFHIFYNQYLVCLESCFHCSTPVVFLTQIKTYSNDASISVPNLKPILYSPPLMLLLLYFKTEEGFRYTCCFAKEVFWNWFVFVCCSVIYLLFCLLLLSDLSLRDCYIVISQPVVNKLNCLLESLGTA